MPKKLTSFIPLTTGTSERAWRRVSSQRLAKTWLPSSTTTRRWPRTRTRTRTRTSSIKEGREEAERRGFESVVESEKEREREWERRGKRRRRGKETEKKIEMERAGGYERDKERGNK